MRAAWRAWPHVEILLMRAASWRLRAGQRGLHEFGESLKMITVTQLIEFMLLGWTDL
jgi:hypothetical protein